MVDELDEKPGEGLNLQQYVDVVRRRHMYFLIPFFLGWLVVWSASWVLPSRYKSGTLDSGGAAEHAKGLRDAEHNG